MATRKKNIKKKPVKKKVDKKEIQLEGEGLYQVATSLAVQQFNSGINEQKISETLKSTYNILTDANIQFIIYRASKFIADQHVRDKQSVVAIHVKRYDEEIKRLIEFNYDNILDKYKVPTMINNLTNAIEALGAKERVLQLHTKDTQIKIFNKLNAKVKEKKIMFDLNALTLAEKMEYLSLLIKCKKDQNEVFGVIMSTKKEEIVTEDAQFEIVENTNIDQIKRIEPEPEKIAPIVKSLDDVTRKIQKALERKAEKEFKKAGAGHAPTIVDARSGLQPTIIDEEEE